MPGDKTQVGRARHPHVSRSGGNATETCARSLVPECEQTSAPTRTRTASQNRKSLTRPENASTESDACLRPPTRGRLWLSRKSRRATRRGQASEPLAPAPPWACPLGRLLLFEVRLGLDSRA